MRRRDMIVGMGAASAGWAASHVPVIDGSFGRSRFEAVRTRVIALVKDGVVPSMAVAVAEKGRIVWEEGFGFANRERRVPATPQTTYALASVGKALTASAFHLLVDRGLASLDDPIERFIAPTKLRVFEGTASEVTARSLLRMRAGIPHGWWHQWAGDGVQDLSRLVERYAVVALPPNAQYHYSNFSYGVIQLAVERIAKRPFAEFIRDEIFQPAGMKNSHVIPPPSKETGAATAYWPRVDTPVPYWYTEPAGGAGYVSSVHDLALWGLIHLGHAHEGRRLFSSARLQQMHEPPGGFPYNSGWASIADKGGEATLISNGGVVGAMSILKLVPSRDLAVACLANIASEDRITDTVADEVIAAAVPGYRKEMDIPPGIMPVPFSPEAGISGRWAGEVITHAGNVPAWMELDAGGRMTLDLGGRGKNPVLGINVEQGVISGSLEGAHLIPSVSGPQKIQVCLRKTGDRLSGYVLATSTGDRPGTGMPFRMSFAKARERASDG